jgi:hypothetical protein
MRLIAGIIRFRTSPPKKFTDLILFDRYYVSNMTIVGPTKGRYWRTVPLNSSLRNLILDLKQNLNLVNSGFVLPRSKDWNNGDQAVPLKAFLRSIKMKQIKFHALRGWKKSATMDIFLRLTGVDTKGATDCLHFVPKDIQFGDNFVSIFEKRKHYEPETCTHSN